MSTKVAEIERAFRREDSAAWISNLWTIWNDQRAGWLASRKELYEYLFATDTTTTSNQTLPWRNTTTTPKLTQIRDNLHSNYISALFPNDKWLQWTAFTKEDAKHKKAKAITSYMENKTRLGGFKEIVSRLLYDYIDDGNAFAMPAFERRYTRGDGFTEDKKGFIGPVAVRISPYDIVFNPTAARFKDSPKIVRSIKSIGELKKLAKTHPEQSFWKDAIAHHMEMRQVCGQTRHEDLEKAALYAVDGFGNLHEYYQSNYVEILDFYGDYYDNDTGELQENRHITIVDRSIEVRNEMISTADGVAPIYHVGWRFRPDNLWAMGPLDNLVGMQYRIDHLENLKADAMDMSIWTPLKVIGEVEEFTWGPGVQIHIDENGDVQELGKNLNSIVIADNNIQMLEDKMELFAGAPREAMGVRSPGEKTAFEVQTLNNAAGRIFQEKINTFETALLEPLLNSMMEVARRELDEVDVVTTIDSDLGFTEFLEITSDDITARGVIRPIGARHFAQKAQELQNLLGVANSPIWQKIEPHTSGKGLMQYVEDSLGISAYKLFSPNVAIFEMQETEQLMNQAAEDNEVAASMPTPDMREPADESEQQGGFDV